MIGAALTRLGSSLVFWLAVVAVIAVQTYRVHDRDNTIVRLNDKYAVLSNDVEKQKVNAAESLRNAQTTEAELRKQLKDSDEQRKIDSLAHSAEVKTLAADIATLRLRNNGVFRDPNAGSGPRRADAGIASTAVGGNGAANAAETPGLLSAQLTELLSARFLEADELNVAYTDCRAQLIPLLERLRIQAATVDR